MVEAPPGVRNRNRIRIRISLRSFSPAPSGAGFHFGGLSDAPACARVRDDASMRRLRKRHAPPLDAPFETRVRGVSAAFPSRELPTFNGLYPSIVARQLSQ
jgi:hypothetical protein